MAEHRPHPTDTTADIPEADLLEQQTPLLTEHDPLEAAPPEVSPAALMVDEADYLVSGNGRRGTVLPTGRSTVPRSRGDL